MVLSRPLPVPDAPVEELPAPRAIESLPDLKPPPRLEAPPPPVREIPPARIEPVALEPMPIRTEIAPRPMPPAPKPPPVLVGAFPSDSAAVRTSEAVREVRSAGFEPPTAKAPEIKISGPSVGAFDVPAGGADPHPGRHLRATNQFHHPADVHRERQSQRLLVVGVRPARRWCRRSGRTPARRQRPPPPGSPTSAA